MCRSSCFFAPGTEWWATTTATAGNTSDARLVNRSIGLERPGLLVEALKGCIVLIKSFHDGASNMSLKCRFLQV